MAQYSRKYPEFSLCGLNCVLCPRFQAEGKSKCPGCGGENFFQVHPSCSVITCSKKHEVKEFCYECNEFTCKKYDVPKKKDSFISKKYFLNDISKAQADIHIYIDNLKIKQKILEKLIWNYNDGRAKSYYCLAVNLIPLNYLNNIIEELESTISDDIDIKKKAKLAKEKLEKVAESLKIVIELRK